jgi:hypothetical protein
VKDLSRLSKIHKSKTSKPEEQTTTPSEWRDEPVVVGSSVFFGPVLLGAIVGLVTIVISLIIPKLSRPMVLVTGGIIAAASITAPIFTRRHIKIIKQSLWLQGKQLLEINWRPISAGFGRYAERAPYEIIYVDKLGKIHRANCMIGKLSPIYLVDDKIIGSFESGEIYFRGKFHKIADRYHFAKKQG